MRKIQGKIPDVFFGKLFQKNLKTDSEKSFRFFCCHENMRWGSPFPSFNSIEIFRSGWIQLRLRCHQLIINILHGLDYFGSRWILSLDPKQKGLLFKGVLSSSSQCLAYAVSSYMVLSMTMEMMLSNLIVWVLTWFSQVSPASSCFFTMPLCPISNCMIVSICSSVAGIPST